MSKITMKVGDEAYHLPEINEYELPTVALVAGFDHAEASQYHRGMVDSLLAETEKEGSILTLWAYQVIAAQQSDIDALMRKLDEIEIIVRRRL